MFFAAKEAVERRATRRGRAEGIVEGIEEGIVEGIEEGIVEGIEEGIVEGIEEGIVEGIEEGRRAERGRIARMLAEYGVAVSPELARKLNGSGDAAETGAE